MHVHVSALNALVTILYVVAGFGLLSALALKFNKHPAAQAWLDLYGRGTQS
jgi:hypothetical protein